MNHVTHLTSLATLLSSLELTQGHLSRGTGISRSAVHRLVVDGKWPARAAAAARKKVQAFLQACGVTPDQVEAALAAPAKKLASVVGATEAVPEEATTHNPEEDAMLQPKQTLTESARKKFGLFVNPFAGEVTSDEEMFTNGEIRFVQEAAWQAAIGARMVAIIGESGAGKTTMLDDLKEKITRQHKPIVCIEPSVEGMEDNDHRGKSMKSADIQAAIVYTLDHQATVALGAEKRSRQVYRMLEESTTSGRSHLLIIEEAHALPVPTLNHLKRLHEKMRMGRRPMLGILLLGHPELEKKLSRYDVREVMQRTEIARLRPLEADLGAYLQVRVQRVGRKLEELITPDGVDELRSRLTVNAGDRAGFKSLLYPLNVNNWMIAALNTAAELGAPRVDRDVIRAV